MYLPQCYNCKNYVSRRGCLAFAYIPKPIIYNEYSHTEPFEGDNGIRFEPIADIKRPDTPQE